MRTFPGPVRSRAISLILLASAFLTIPLHAQFTSAVEGTVADPQGAAVPNATLTLRNTETGSSATATTSATGYYRFPSLPSTVFKLSATATGFKTTEFPEFRVQISETKTLNINLELGTQTSVVTVESRTPLIETSEGRV